MRSSRRSRKRSRIAALTSARTFPENPALERENVRRLLQRSERVDENLAALDVGLMADEVALLSAALPPGAAAGTRYPEAAMKAVYL